VVSHLRPGGGAPAAAVFPEAPAEADGWSAAAPPAREQSSRPALPIDELPEPVEPDASPAARPAPRAARPAVTAPSRTAPR
jgi:hypothetical protein